jgi:hypothetical protein
MKIHKYKKIVAKIDEYTDFLNLKVNALENQFYLTFDCSLRLEFGMNKISVFREHEASKDEELIFTVDKTETLTLSYVEFDCEFLSGGYDTFSDYETQEMLHWLKDQLEESDV